MSTRHPHAYIQASNYWANRGCPFPGNGGKVQDDEETVFEKEGYLYKKLEEVQVTPTRRRKAWWD